MSLFPLCDKLWNRLARIELTQKLILERITKMSTSVSQIDAELTVIEGIDTTLAAAVTATIADLEAKANANSVDLTPELTRLQNIATALQNVQSTSTAADPGSPVLNATTTTLTGSTTDAAGSNVSLSITVAAPTGDAVPTVNINVLDGTTSLGSTGLDSTGAASFTIVSITAGSHSYTAQYVGDSANSASTSEALVVVAS